MRPIILLFTVLLSLPVAGNTREPDVGAGRQLYTACSACHGAAGEGSATLQAPRLSHLEPVYIAAQLRKFSSGLRGGEGADEPAVRMAGMAGTLADEGAMDDVAAFIATLDGAASPPVVEGDRTLGADYYNQLCGACHGPAAAGNRALHSPRLAGSDDWYLLSQLQAFRAGQRGSHADDRTGRQMRAMAKVLPGEQAMRDVVAFIRSLEP